MYLYIRDCFKGHFSGPIYSWALDMTLVCNNLCKCDTSIAWALSIASIAFKADAAPVGNPRG